MVFIDKRVNEILEQYIHIEVERLTNNIVSREVSKIMAESSHNSFLNITKSSGVIENISYNTGEINKLTDKISLRVHKRLINLEAGDIEDSFLVDTTRGGKFKHIKSGILCDVSLGSVKSSTLFANVGPKIPIKLTFIGQVNTELDVQVKEYGINNVIIEMNVIVKVREHTSMPLTSKKKDIVVKEPISIELIKGEIPDYYNGIIK